MLRPSQSFEFKNREYKVVSMRGKAYETYISTTKNREKMSFKHSCIKFTHHLVLGKFLGFTNKGLEKYSYGNLEFSYDRETNRIVWIDNHKGKCIHELQINKEDSRELKNILYEKGKEEKYQTEENKETIFNKIMNFLNRKCEKIGA